MPTLTTVTKRSRLQPPSILHLLSQMPLCLLDTTASTPRQDILIKRASCWELNPRILFSQKRTVYPPTSPSTVGHLTEGRRVRPTEPYALSGIHYARGDVLLAGHEHHVGCRTPRSETTLLFLRHTNFSRSHFEVTGDARDDLGEHFVPSCATRESLGTAVL